MYTKSIMNKINFYFFFFLFFFLSFFSSGVIDSIDGFMYLSIARNIYYKHDPVAPPNEYNSGKNIYMGTYIGKNGKTYSATGIGYSLAYIPAVVITDLFYQHYNIIPPEHFPLESDWLILFTASFTNAIFGALLGTIIFNYLLLFKLRINKAFLITFLGIISTFLWSLTKHSFPHMMFIFFLTSSFYFLKKYSLNPKKIFIFLSGVSYGFLIITYNQTFLLPVIPYLIYYLLLIKPKITFKYKKASLLNIIIFAAALLPFLVLFLLYEKMRAYGSIDQGSASFIIAYTKRSLFAPITIIFEGLWGQLFSPGRSVFIYAPIFLLILLFWNKIKKKYYPEFVLFITISLVYILFYSMQYSIGKPDQGIAGLWHGESSWGPRYLSPIIPFGILIVGIIYNTLSKKLVYLVFVPLSTLGIYIQLLGVLMPYQIKFQELQNKFYVNSTEYTVHIYSNLLPRYSPIIMMSKKLIKLVINFPKTIDHGKYHVKFFDGIDFPFNVGPERWRKIDSVGYISFDNKYKDIEKISFDLINHPISTTKETSEINFYLNDKLLNKNPLIIKIAERKSIDLSINKQILRNNNNQLKIIISFADQTILRDNKQILGLIAMHINDNRINFETVDVPYVSILGPLLTKINYLNWGGNNQNLWNIWNIHSQVFERTPDFWWIKPLYYWDLPQKTFIIMLSINILGLFTFLLLLRNQKTR